MSRTSAAIAITVFASALVLGACDLAPPPDKQSAAAQKADQHTELRDAINTPIDKAKAANDPNVQHDQDQDQAIDNQSGG